MGYSWTKLIKDEFGRKGAKRSFTLALILMMFAGVLAFILPAPVVAGTKTKLEGFDKTSGKWSTGNLDGWKELDWVPYRIEFSDLPEGASSYTFNVYHNNLLDDKVGFDRLGGFRVGDEDGNPVTGSVTVSGPFYETLGKWGDKDIYYTITVSFTTPSPRLSWYFYWQAHLAYGASGWPGSSLHAYADISGKVSINVPPTPVGSISGYKWNDLNRDGTWDPNEQGLSGWTIQLYSFDSFESAWIHLADENTDSTGRYTFALVAGNYRLYEVLNGNWTQTFPPSGYHEIVLSEGETKDNINFGNFLFPTITTRSATGITTTGATMNADFAIGSYGSVDVWFQYRVQGGDTWIETTPATYTSSGSHSDYATGLSPETTYEFRAVLQYDTEKIYGDVLTFTTLNIIPTVTTLTATGVTTAQATMNADFTVGSYGSVDVWFQYRVQGGDTWIETLPTTYTASGNHSNDVTDLSPDTTYEFRAALQYDTEKTYGDILTFTTLNVIPTVTTLAATGVTTTQATMNADFTVGIYDSVDFWFEYRVQGGDTWIETTPATYTASGSHSDDVTDLSPDTTYEFRAVLQYDNEKIYGDVLTFTTLNVIPIVTTNAATGLTTAQATMNADFTVGSYGSVDVWFEYRVQGGDTWIETTPATYTASGSHSDDAMGLSSDTTHEFRAVLQYDNEKIYGDVLTFTTLNVIPTVTTLAATGVTTTQATMNADFNVDSYGSVDVWFEYRVQGGHTWIETTPATYTASGSHLDDVTDLSPDTTYEFRAVLQYDKKKIYGDVLTFSTLNVIPTVTTLAATGVTTNQATMNADFTVGIYDSVDFWFEYRVQGGDTWIETTPTTYTSSGSHSDDAMGLSSDTTHEFRAVLQYNPAKINGDSLTFTTKAVQPPSAPNLKSPADGTITNDNTLTFKWTAGANADNYRLLVDNDADFSSPEKNVLLGAKDKTYTISAPGLADGNYSWKVIAINAYGEIESSTWTFVIDTIDPVEVTFDRRLSGDKVGQHKAPPTSPVNITITATVSSQVNNSTLADYFPSDWTVTDANGGIVSVYDENYNKIEWDVGAFSDSVSRSYVVRSPQRTLPPTKYYFHSELTYSGGSAISDDWMVIVADPVVPPSPTPPTPPTEPTSTSQIGPTSTSQIGPMSTSQIEPTSTPPVSLIEPTPAQPPLSFYMILSVAAVAVGFLTAYSMLAKPSRYYVMLKRLKQLALEPIVPRVGHIGLPLLVPPAGVAQIRTHRTRAKRKEEGIMSKEREEFRKFEDANRELRATERELHHMEENRWSFTKNMMKFGFASWIFGLSVFLFAITLMGTGIFGGAPVAWSSMLVGTPLLVGAPAAPLMMISVFTRKHDNKIKRLRHIRRGLVTEYQGAALQYVEQVAASA